MSQLINIRERRTRQFEHYLGLMEHRTLRQVKSDCYLVFSVPAPRPIRPQIFGSRRRIVQFAFSTTEFYLDLPDSTLTRDEALTAVSRPGFEFGSTGPHKRQAPGEYDPVQRRYEYAELRTAAEDAAWVFFDLWGTRVEAWIKVQAGKFGGGREWERSFSMG